MKKKISLFLASIVLLCISTKPSFAVDMTYSVSADIPSNQIDKSLNYFDLMMKPGEEQDVSVTITNQSDEKETFKLSINNALTTENGEIDYTNHGVEPDESLNYSMEKLVTNNRQEVEIKPGETTKVIFRISLPTEKIEGIVLGGIHISKQQKETASNKKNMTIKNTYSYIIGLQIRQETTSVTPEINLTDIKTSLVNNHLTVVTNLQNSVASLLRKVSIDTKITKKQDSKLLMQTKKENMSIAPNTNFNFLIDGENAEFSSELYTLNMHVSSDQGDWNFTKDFKVKNKQVIQMTEKVKTDNSRSVYILSSIIAVFILGGFFIYFMFKKSSSNET